PFLLPLLFFAGDLHLGSRFWLALIAGGSLNIATTIMYMKALKSSALSVTVPMVTFTPVFLFIISPILLGEFPPLSGISGIILVVLGAYFLNIKEKSSGLAAPFKALLREKGPRLMLGVAFIWSITSNLDKIGIQNSSVAHWAIAVHIFTIIVMVPVVWFASRYREDMAGASFMRDIVKSAKILGPLGFVNALKYICQLAALQFTLVAYVISIKRTSAVISVIFGFLIFKEDGIKERLLGAVIMIAGVLLITL
ncbi:MAG: EamA family transporter, partial [bacterium]|nr:EamA family transporter [bacterium]